MTTLRELLDLSKELSWSWQQRAQSAPMIARNNDWGGLDLDLDLG